MTSPSKPWSESGWAGAMQRPCPLSSPGSQCKQPSPSPLLPLGSSISCSTTIPEPLVSLNTEVPLPLHSPAVWAKKGIMEPKIKQANCSTTLEQPSTCGLRWVVLSYGAKLNQISFHDLPDGCKVAGEVGLSVSIKEKKYSRTQWWTTHMDARCYGFASQVNL